MATAAEQPAAVTSSASADKPASDPDASGRETLGKKTLDKKTLDKKALEEGSAFQPRFDRDGLIACVTVDDRDGAVLMVAHMNAEALRLTLETGVAHYWSRSRGSLWRKGDTSGQTQSVVDLRTDCDQDALVMRVLVAGDGGACHTGRRSCFYRAIHLAEGGEPVLEEIAT